MLVIRPIEAGDFEALRRCARESGIGFTSLPEDDTFLKRKLDLSLECFRQEPKEQAHDAQKEALYFFVAIQPDTHEVVGTCAIDAAVGLRVPFYHYHLSNIVHHSPKLDIYNAVQLLTLNNDYTGKTELCSLFLRKEHRVGYNGRLLSKSRFLFLKAFAHLFSRTIFAEMRGVVDAQGNSPFWEWLQRHFFSIDFSTADYLTGIGRKRFISDLMPHYPIYVNLLSDEAKHVIGQTHPQTTPALKMLTEEGFVYRDYIDIFDGGPTIECELDNIRSIRNCVFYLVEIESVASGHRALLSNQKFADFRATYAEVAFDSRRERVIITPDVAQRLQVGLGDTIQVMEV